VSGVELPALTALGLLQVGTPDELLTTRVPAQVPVMELAVVGEQDDLAGQPLLGRDADRDVDGRDALGDP